MGRDCFGFVLALLGGCSSPSSGNLPTYTPGGGTGATNPVDCATLRDGGSAIASQVPGTLVADGGPIECFGVGNTCVLPNDDGNVCDGGIAEATCSTGETWVGDCVALDGGTD